jgi:hypothetical protein
MKFVNLELEMSPVKMRGCQRTLINTHSRLTETSLRVNLSVRASMHGAEGEEVARAN